MTVRSPLTLRKSTEAKFIRKFWAASVSRRGVYWLTSKTLPRHVKPYWFSRKLSVAAHEVSGAYQARQFGCPAPPLLVVDLNYPHVDNEPSVRLFAVAEEFMGRTAKVQLRQCGDTKTYSLRCLWTTFATDDPNIQVNEFSTADNHSLWVTQPDTVRHITFQLT